MQQRFTHWKKSSRSADTGNCVEVAVTTEATGVRDTKDRAAGHFTVAPRQWQSFLNQIKNGRFDR